MSKRISKESGPDLTDSEVRVILVRAMAEVGSRSRIRLCVQKTGVYISEENVNRSSEHSLKAFDSAVDEYFKALSRPVQ